jgi:hypothetical protein
MMSFALSKYAANEIRLLIILQYVQMYDDHDYFISIGIDGREGVYLDTYST